jgi:putative phage-type endonuclease
VSDADWHAWRAEGLGASDIAGVLGISPWASPWSVWADKMGLLPPSNPSIEMEFGKRAEAMVGPWFHDRTGLWVTGEQTWCTHPDIGWARATVDGFVSETDTPAPDELAGVLEIKTDGPGRDWATIPAHYQAQAQWQMFVTGLPHAWFAVLHGRRFQIYELARDDDDIAFMYERAEAFWRNHVLTCAPPEVDGSDATTDAIAAVYPEPAYEFVGVARHLVEAARAAKAALKAAKEAEAAACNAVRAAMQDATVAVDEDGQKIATWKVQERRGVDLERLAADHLALIDQYRTVSTHRVLRLTKEPA